MPALMSFWCLVRGLVRARYRCTWDLRRATCHSVNQRPAMARQSDIRLDVRGMKKLTSGVAKYHRNLGPLLEHRRL